MTSEAQKDSTARASGLPPLRRETCEACWGAGEWDEGPIGGYYEPIYRQVVCGACDGMGWIVIEDDGSEDRS